MKLPPEIQNVNQHKTCTHCVRKFGPTVLQWWFFNALFWRRKLGTYSNTKNVLGGIVRGMSVCNFVNWRLSALFTSCLTGQREQFSIKIFKKALEKLMSKFLSFQIGRWSRIEFPNALSGLADVTSINANAYLVAKDLPRAF